MLRQVSAGILAALLAMVLFVPGTAFGAGAGQSKGGGSVQAAGSSRVQSAVLSLGAPSTSASATVAEGVINIVSSLDGGAAVDVAGASTADGAKVQVFRRNVTPAQRWRFESAGGGFYRIVNVGSGKVLEVLDGRAVSGAKVVQKAWRGSAAQKWKAVAMQGGYRLVAALSDSFALSLSGTRATNGTALQLASLGASKTQLWKLEKVTAAIADGVYTIKARNSGKALDVAGGSVEIGANVQQYSANGTIAQSFQFQFDHKTGYYTIYSVHTGLALDVKGGSLANGANIQLYKPNGTAAQRWALARNSDGTVSLFASRSGKAVDVQGASSADGANVQLYSSNGTAAQKFTFAKVGNWIPNGTYTFVSAKRTGAALAVKGSSRSVGSNVQVGNRADGTWAQTWVVRQQGDTGYYTIRNVNSRMALDVMHGIRAAQTNVQQWEANLTDAQLWKPTLTSSGIVWSSKLDSNLVLDLAWGKTTSGTNLWVFAKNNTEAQKFRLCRVEPSSLVPSSGLFVFANVATNTVIDVEGASTANNAKVQLYTDNGTAAQKFRLVSKGGGQYALVNINSGKAVSAAGTSVVQNGAGDASSQRWRISFDLDRVGFTFASVSSGKRLHAQGGALVLADAKATAAQCFSLKETQGDYFRVYVDAGHGWNSSGNGRYDPGAMANGNVEADLTAELTDLVIKYARELYGLDVVDGKPFAIPYWERVSKAAGLGCSAFVSIHFDSASNPNASGPMGMVGVSGRHPASLKLNEIMFRHLSTGLAALPKRAISYRNDIAVVNNSLLPACLQEVCFVTNTNDMSYYRSRKDVVARELAAGLYEASREPTLRKAA
ncbi:MAG: RICIN domain-containing protein [Eggerthellaceae bacterium]|nr:RICIN domain-containing protein [Eggerthellaceae bacterium]